MRILNLCICVCVCARICVSFHFHRRRHTVSVCISFLTVYTLYTAKMGKRQRSVMNRKIKRLKKWWKFPIRHIYNIIVLVDNKYIRRMINTKDSERFSSYSVTYIWYVRWLDAKQFLAGSYMLAGWRCVCANDRHNANVVMPNRHSHITDIDVYAYTCAQYYKMYCYLTVCLIWSSVVVVIHWESQLVIIILSVRQWND